MEELKFIGRSLKDRDWKVYGSGYVKHADGSEYVDVNGNWIGIESGSLHVEREDMDGIEDMRNHDVSEADIVELHELLVNTAAGFLAEKGIESVDDISFTVDSIQNAVASGVWTCFTDSSLALYGYEDGRRKLIGESM